MRLRAALLPLATAAALGGCDGDGPLGESGASRDGLSQLGLTREVPDELVNACSRAAEKTQLEAVYCPPLAPEGELALDYATSYRGLPSNYGLSMRSEGLDEPRSGGHWAIEAVQGHRLQYLILEGIRRVRERPQVERIRLAGKPATVVSVQAEANTFHKGHVVVLWRAAGVSYDVSLHGHDNAAQAKVIATALIGQMRTCASVDERQAGDERCRFVIEGGSAESAE